MKLLLDANLSWRLVKILHNEFEDLLHVSTLNLSKPAKDHEIWSYALKNGFVIVSNDDDFNILSQRLGFPPKIILLKTGNQSTEYIANVLLTRMSDISDFIGNSEYGLLEIY
jgi:predicted nuclease of predicted toxin-antitoxin system